MGEGCKEKESRAPQPSVSCCQPTAAVDMELSEPGSRALLSHTGIVYMGWGH